MGGGIDTMEECDRAGRQDDGERTDSARRKDRQEAEGCAMFRPGMCYTHPSGFPVSFHLSASCLGSAVAVTP